MDLHQDPLPAPTHATGHSDQPGVAVGSTVVLPSDGGTYALYYLFPMGEEQQTLLLLRRVLLRPACCCCCWSPGWRCWSPDR